MGNEASAAERHVVFASDGPNYEESYGGRSPRSGTTTYRQTTTRSPGRMDDWDERPVGRAKGQQTREWLQYDDVEDDLDPGWRRRSGGQPYQSSTRSTVRVTPNSRVTRTTSYFPQRSLMARSFPSAGYHEERSPSRAFNTRDPDDRWYHYQPEVNRRADWALVGRHVRPSSAVTMRRTTSSGIPSRLYDDDDSATSDPTSDRLRRGTGGPGMVRRTDNPRVQNGSRTVYWEDDDYGESTYGRWPRQQSSARYQQPTNSSYYRYQTQSYRR